MAEIYEGADKSQKAHTWRIAAHSVLYEEALQDRLIFSDWRELQEPLEHNEVESIRELDRAYWKIVDSEHGVGIIATLQIRREAYQAATGQEIVLEQAKALGLLAEIIETGQRVPR